jgi:hypothetical protein
MTHGRRVFYIMPLPVSGSPSPSRSINLPDITVVAAMSDNTNVINDTFRVDMVFPLYFPTLSTLANVRAAEFRQ